MRVQDDSELSSITNNNKIKLSKQYFEKNKNSRMNLLFILINLIFLLSYNDCLLAGSNSSGL